LAERGKTKSEISLGHSLACTGILSHGFLGGLKLRSGSNQTEESGILLSSGETIRRLHRREGNIIAETGLQKEVERRSHQGGRAEASSYPRTTLISWYSEIGN